MFLCKSSVSSCVSRRRERGILQLRKNTTKRHRSPNTPFAVTDSDEIGKELFKLANSMQPSSNRNSWHEVDLSRVATLFKEGQHDTIDVFVCFGDDVSLQVTVSPIIAIRATACWAELLWFCQLLVLLPFGMAEQWSLRWHTTCCEFDHDLTSLALPRHAQDLDGPRR